MAMSTTITAQAADVQKPEQPATATVPRKRRRRAPATGASEDCFACRKRGAKCDRKRPYCGQCIEIGKECSGYRTTLTWGVGVASRGKLRGLSLPVAKSQNQTSTTHDTKAQTSTSASSTTKTATVQPTSTRVNTRGSIDFGLRSPTSPVSPHTMSVPQEYQFYGQTSPIPIPSPNTPMGFAVPTYGEHMDPMLSYPWKMGKPHMHRGPLQRLQTSLNVPFDDGGLSASSASLGTYSDSDLPSPTDYPHTPADEFPFAESFSRYSSMHLPDNGSFGSIDHLRFLDSNRPLPVADDMSSSISSDQSLQDFHEINSGRQSMGPPVYPDIFIEGDIGSNIHAVSQPGLSFLPSEGTSSIDSGPLTFGKHALTTSIPQSLIAISNLSPRMRYLLDFFANAICPVLVAGDGPTNPYRMHIMPLAMRSEGLRNAIAALATNNMRMRGGTEGRRISNAPDLCTLPEHAFSQMTPQELREMHGQPTAEEKHYKAQSITMLNQELATSQGAHDDAVLATLLVLCLFHVCDSGFSKFRTQLAGVQKLLSMRDRRVQSDFVGWIEFFFTWFDVLTSALNDRETEVQGDTLDMMNLSANLGASEHLSGCDGRLFKLLARLGRLNLLSQNRPVRESDATPLASPRTIKQEDFYSLSFGNIDGNGWRTLDSIPERPRDLSSPTARAAFWSEWHDIRARLHEWESATASGEKPVLSMIPVDMPETAMLHMSESFRYAALLYTERLAHPAAPPHSLNFQGLVARGLLHISQIGITSCVNKFLLWPLFIIGTECVESEHRAVVRQRCVEIQRESGFFNNLSGLQVLEKVWQEDDEVSEDVTMPPWQDSQDVPQQAFRWRKAMDRVDGEYIMI